MKIKLIVFFLTLGIINLYSQDIKSDSIAENNNLKFKYEALIIPTSMILFGVIGLESHTLKSINSDTKEEILEHIDNKLTIDNFTQFSAFLSAYGLNALGIKGKNRLLDRTIILGTAFIIMGSTVSIIKATSNVERPDGTSNNSFPSGHTATAFMGAEFLYQEYKDVSIWYGVAGYAVATGTGLFRLYNNRHWVTDIVAGAGIGILSTKMAYWLHPIIKKTIFKDKKNTNGIVAPFYHEKAYGLALSMTF